MKRLMIVFILLILTMTGCGQSDSDSSNAAGEYDFSYTDRELDPSYDIYTAEKIKLQDDSDVSITEEGTYIVSGTLTDGQIKIETPDDQKVQLVLDNVNISCSDNAPLLIEESDKVFVTLAEGSVNTLTGPASTADDNIDGVIFSRADLCINGTGKLEISGSCHGIVSKDDLVITGGALDISANGDGLQGKDCVKINGGNIKIDASNDGIKSSNNEDADRGFVSIDGGSFDITAGYDGLQAETVLRIAGGDFDIETGGGSGNASTDADWQNDWGHGGPDKMHGGMPPDMAGNDAAQSDDSSDSISAKGLKASIDLMVLDGNININSSDDAIHSNGDISIKKGTISVTSGDDGIHADSDLVISDGTVVISKSYEGLEGNTIQISGGDIDVTASDDGLNAAGGNDGSSTEDRPGQNEFSADETAWIEINGGKLNIDASGDGIDSNGDLMIEGGKIYVSGPENDGNGTLDYAGTAVVDGGQLILTGSSGMAQTFDNSSSQCVILYGFSSVQPAGAKITLEDSSGNQLLSYTSEKRFASAILSCSELTNGETYSIYVDGQVAATIQMTSNIMIDGYYTSMDGHMR